MPRSIEVSHDYLRIIGTINKYLSKTKNRNKNRDDDYLYFVYKIYYPSNSEMDFKKDLSYAITLNDSQVYETLLGPDWRLHINMNNTFKTYDRVTFGLAQSAQLSQQSLSELYNNYKYNDTNIKSYHSYSELLEDL